MKPGDRVAVIDDNLEGVITGIVNNLVTFEDEYGFEHRYSSNKLVVIDDKLNLLETRIPSIKNKIPSKRTRSNSLKTPVFDLHIEKLQPRHRHLSSGQKLEIQLQEVQRVLQKFERQHYREIVFIHGEGKGVLRQEIERILRHKGFQFTDASYQKYGNGGILVLKK